MLIGLVWAADTPEGITPSVTVVRSPEEELQEAVRKYQLQQLSSAIVSFHDLAISPDVPLAIQLEARVYLGELQLLEGNADRARRQFENVVRADPSYRIDLFRHPPEVGVLFNEVREQLIPTLTPSPPPSVFLPLLYHGSSDALTQDWPLTLLEGTFASCATGLNIYLLINRDQFLNTNSERVRAQSLRITQLSCFTGVVGTHIWRTVRTRKHHTEQWRTTLLYGQVSPTSHELIVGVDITF